MLGKGYIATRGSLPWEQTHSQGQEGSVEQAQDAHPYRTGHHTQNNV